jgi:hypothetical protein
MARPRRLWPGFTTEYGKVRRRRDTTKLSARCAGVLQEDKQHSAKTWCCLVCILDWQPISSLKPAEREG